MMQNESVTEEMKAKWIASQKNTFTKWCNNHLKKKGYQLLEDIYVDFSDGVRLMLLIHSIYGVPVPKFNKNARTRIHKLDNLANAFKMISEAEIPVKLLKPENLVDHDQRMILGMIWTMILHSSIQFISIEDATAKDGLLLWCQKNTKGYRGVDPPGLKNFHRDWKSGMAFCALIHKFRPDLLDYNSLNPSDPEECLETAFSVAEEHLDIPRLLEVRDIVDMPKPDEHSVITYVSEYFHKLAAGNMKENAADKVNKYLEFRNRNKILKDDYEKRAKLLVEWLLEKIQWFKNPTDDKTSSIKDFEEYVKSDKPNHEAEDFEIRNIYYDLQQRLASNGQPAYIPPKDLSLASIDEHWTSLKNNEVVYKSIKDLIDEYDNMASSLSTWTQEQDESLNQNISTLSIDEMKVELTRVLNLKRKVIPQKNNVDLTQGCAFKLVECRRQQSINGVSEYFPSLSIEKLSIDLKNLDERISEYSSQLSNGMAELEVRQLRKQYESEASAIKEWIGEAINQTDNILINHVSMNLTDFDSIRSQLDVLKATKNEKEESSRSLMKIYLQSESLANLNKTRRLSAHSDSVSPKLLESDFLSLSEHIALKEKELENARTKKTLKNSLDEFSRRAELWMNSVSEKSSLFDPESISNFSDMAKYKTALEDFENNELQNFIKERDMLLKDYAEIQSMATTAFCEEEFQAPSELSPNALNSTLSSMLNSQERWKERIRHMETTGDVPQQLSNYDEKAKELISWAEGETSRFNSTRISSADQALEAKTELQSYSENTLPQKILEKQQLTELYGELMGKSSSLSQRRSGSAVVTEPSVLENAFQSLEKAKANYLLRIEDTILFWEVNNLQESYSENVSALIDWANASSKRFQEDDVTTLEEVERAEELIENFKAVDKREKDLAKKEALILYSNISKRNLQLKEPVKVPILLSPKALNTAFEDLDSSLIAYSAKVSTARIVAQMGSAFNSYQTQAEALLVWTKDKGREMNEMNLNSKEDVDYANNYIKSFDEIYEEKDRELKSLVEVYAEIHSKVASLSSRPPTSDSFSPIILNSAFNNLASLRAELERRIDCAIDSLKTSSALSTFVKRGNDFINWAESKSIELKDKNFADDDFDSFLEKFKKDKDLMFMEKNSLIKEFQDFQRDAIILSRLDQIDDSSFPIESISSAISLLKSAEDALDVNSQNQQKDLSFKEEVSKLENEASKLVEWALSESKSMDNNVILNSFDDCSRAEHYLEVYLNEVKPEKQSLFSDWMKRYEDTLLNFTDLPVVISSFAAPSELRQAFEELERSVQNYRQRLEKSKEAARTLEAVEKYGKESTELIKWARSEADKISSLSATPTAAARQLIVNFQEIELPQKEKEQLLAFEMFSKIHFLDIRLAAKLSENPSCSPLQLKKSFILLHSSVIDFIKRIDDVEKADKLESELKNYENEMVPFVNSMKTEIKKIRDVSVVSLDEVNLNEIYLKELESILQSYKVKLETMISLYADLQVSSLNHLHSVEKLSTTTPNSAKNVYKDLESEVKNLQTKVAEARILLDSSDSLEKYQKRASELISWSNSTATYLRECDICSSEAKTFFNQLETQDMEKKSHEKDLLLSEFDKFSRGKVVRDAFESTLNTTSSTESIRQAWNSLENEFADFRRRTADKEITDKLREAIENIEKRVDKLAESVASECTKLEEYEINSLESSEDAENYLNNFQKQIKPTYTSELDEILQQLETLINERGDDPDRLSFDTTRSPAMLNESFKTLERCEKEFKQRIERSRSTATIRDKLNKYESSVLSLIQWAKTERTNARQFTDVNESNAKTVEEFVKACRKDLVDQHSVKEKILQDLASITKQAAESSIKVTVNSSTSPSVLNAALSDLEAALIELDVMLTDFNSKVDLEKSMLSYEAQARDLIDWANNEVKILDECYNDPTMTHFNQFQQSIYPEKCAVLDKILKEYAEVQKKKVLLRNPGIANSASLTARPAALEAAFTNLRNKMSSVESQKGLEKVRAQSSATDSLEKYERLAKQMIGWIVSTKARINTTEQGISFEVLLKDIDAKYEEFDVLKQEFRAVQFSRFCRRQEPYVPPSGLTPNDVRFGLEELDTLVHQKEHQSAINKALKKSSELIREYESRAAIVVEWLKAKAQSFKRGLNLKVDSAEASATLIKEFRTYIRDERSSRQVEVFLLSTVHAEIESLLSFAKQPAYKCPEGLSPVDLRIWVAELFDAEANRRMTLRAAIDEFLVRSQSRIAPEKVREIQQSFSHFDVNGSGSLDKAEFRAAARGLGVDFSDDKSFDEVFLEVSSADGDSERVRYEEYMQFMIKKFEVSYDFDELENALSEMSDGAAYIREDQLNIPSLGEENLRLLKEQMPRTDEGHYDYKAWIELQKQN